MLAYRAVFNGSNKLLNWVGISLIVSRILSWSPYNKVFNSGKSRDTVLLEVGNYLISFIGCFAKLFNLGVVV